MSEASGGVAAEQLTCELPGCTNVMEYSGVGRKPKYCGRIVDGIPHNRLTAHKVANGQLTLPAPGSRGGVDAEAATTRPVSLARMTIEALRDEVGATINEHQERMAHLLGRFEDALASATDPDAAHAEVTAAHREARAQVDAAETARDRAESAARTAAAETEAARAAQRQAEQAAEEALTAVEDVELERDRARADVTRLTEELEHAQSLLSERDGQLAQARQEADAVRAEVSRLQMQLTAATADVEHLERRLGEEQHERAELARRTDAAEQRAERADRANQTLSTQLDAARDDAARHRDAASELRAQLATATAIAEGLREQLAAERAHGQQRVDDADARAAVQLEDLRLRHERDLAELRTQLDAVAGTNRPSTPRRGNRRRTARGSDTAGTGSDAASGSDPGAGGAGGPDDE